MSAPGPSSSSAPSSTPTVLSNAAAQASDTVHETTSELSSSLSVLVNTYRRTATPRVKLVDAFLLFCVLSGVIQFAYRVVVTSYPYNAFAAGFGSTVGQFVLLAGLRAQVAPGRDAEFKDVSTKRAFADFCAASIVLHLFAFNFLG